MGEPEELWLGGGGGDEEEDLTLLCLSLKQQPWYGPQVPGLGFARPRPTSAGGRSDCLVEIPRWHELCRPSGLNNQIGRRPKKTGWVTGGRRSRG